MNMSLSSCNAFKEKWSRCLVDPSVNTEQIFNTARDGSPMACGHNVYIFYRAGELLFVFDSVQYKWTSIALSSAIPMAYSSIQLTWLYKDKLFVFALGDTHEFRYADIVLAEWCDFTVRDADCMLGSRTQTTGQLHEGSSQFIIFGGYGDIEPDNRLYVLDHARNVVFEPNVRGTKPVARKDAGSCIVGNTMFVYGGDDAGFGGGPHAMTLRDLHCLTISKHGFSWSEVIISAPLERMRHGMACVQGRIFVYGGTDQNFHVRNEVFLIDLSAKEMIALDARTEEFTFEQETLAEFGNTGRPYNTKPDLIERSGKLFLFSAKIDFVGSISALH